MNDILQGTILLIAALAVILCGLVLYLIVLVDQLKNTLSRLYRHTFRPEVPRDGNGRRFYERR